MTRIARRRLPVARKRADTRMICGDADGMQACALVTKAIEDQAGSLGTKPPYLAPQRTPASASRRVRRQTLMQWAGEPTLEEVLSEPIIRAMMVRDRVDQEGLRRLLQDVTKLLALLVADPTDGSA